MVLSTLGEHDIGSILDIDRYGSRGHSNFLLSEVTEKVALLLLHRLIIGLQKIQCDSP